MASRYRNWFCPPSIFTAWTSTGILVGAILLLSYPAYTTPLGISHWDLEGANETCDGRLACEPPPRLRSRGSWSRVGGEDLDWRERNCLCDRLCAKYGDCCLDSKYYVAAEQRRSAATFSCIDLRQFGGIYMKTSCPPSWEDPVVRELCEKEYDQSDPLASMPVTSHETGFTYKNAQCALCHGDLTSVRVDIWTPRMECPSLVLHHNLSREVVMSSMQWDPDRNAWGLYLPIQVPVEGASASSSSSNSNMTQFHKCRIDPMMPETSQHTVRRCQADTVRTCAVNWTNAEVRSRCEAYTGIVYLSKTPYRNMFCAVCNNIGVQFLQCQKSPTRSFQPKEFSPVAFAVLFDLKGGSSSSETVGKTKACPEKQLFDPFFRRCRSVLCPMVGPEASRNQCVIGSQATPKPIPTPSPVSEETSFGDTSEIAVTQAVEDLESIVAHSPDFKRCFKFVLDPSEFQMSSDNNSVTVWAYGKTFPAGEFYLRPHDGSLEICADKLGMEYVDKFGPHMGYVTFAGLGVSILFLVLHLLAFALVPDLRNLSGKNLASLCVALLVAYVAFIAGQLLGKDAGMVCRVVAILTYYSFLASFSWMLTMAMDVWRTLRLATCELRVSTGKQWKKFVVYSIWSWTMPAAIVAVALVIDGAVPGAVRDQFRPGFGMHSCWFAHRQALLILFAAPLAVIMLLNVIFFASSALMIVRTTPSGRFGGSSSGSTSGTRRDFRLYLRLALVMGLTWTVGLLAGSLDIEVLWYAFVALNTLQGLFIFLAFTCNEKVVRGLGSVMPCTKTWGNLTRTLSRGQGDSKPIRPPSFSWSGGSGDSTHKSALGTSSESSSHHGHHGISTISGGINGHSTSHLPHPMHRDTTDTLY